MLDLTEARKNARTADDAAAIAWAQDRIDELENALLRVRGALWELRSWKSPEEFQRDPATVTIDLALAGCDTYEHELNK